MRIKIGEGIDDTQALVRSVGHHLRSPLAEIIHHYDALLDESGACIPEQMRQAMLPVKQRTITVVEDISILSELLWLEAAPRQTVVMTPHRLVWHAIERLKKDSNSTALQTTTDVSQALPHISASELLMLGMYCGLKLMARLVGINATIACEAMVTHVELRIHNAIPDTASRRLSASGLLEQYGESASVLLYTCQRSVRLGRGKFWMRGNQSKTAPALTLHFAIPVIPSSR